jgi:hypothetical protein
VEPLLLILVPGVLGGVLLALLLGHGWVTIRPAGTRRRLAPPSPTLINMARIRVSGGGGLGMFAMAVAVAIFEPRIRVMMLAGVLLGAAFGAALIAWHRRTGPLPSGDHPSAFGDSRLTDFSPDQPGRPDGGRLREPVVCAASS